MSITHKSIVAILAATGASENETQAAVAKFETSDHEGKKALFAELSKRGKTADPEHEEKPKEKTVTDQGVNKGTAKSVKATKAAAELAEANGLKVSEVPAGAGGVVDVKQVNAAIAEQRNG